MKIAQYKSGSSECIFQVSDYMESDRDWVRLTEILDVQFVPLPPEVGVPAQLKQLDEAERELRARFMEKLEELKSRRANLLALTHQVTP